MPGRAYAVVDRRSQRDTSFGRSMTGADQRIARDKEVVDWLTRVYGELQNQSRPWPAFEAKRLRHFLAAAGADHRKAVDAHADALPIPESVAGLEGCLEKLRGASFLAAPVESACMLLNQRSHGAPNRTR